MKAVMITEQGKKNLGIRLKEFRDKKGWSLQKAVDHIYSTTGKRFSRSALGDIENAAVKQIKPDTLLLLAQAGIGGMTFTEMIDMLTENRLILCEKGTPYNVKEKNNELSSSFKCGI